MINIEDMLKNLAEQGWYQQENTFSPSFISHINQELNQRKMKKAGIGQSKEVCNSIRTDNICWIEPDEPSSIIQEYMSFLEHLKIEFNRSFYLNLKGFEVHFAQYQPNGFYKPHYDNFKGKNKRAITAITYLNEKWTPEHGAVLKIHHNDKLIEVQPKAGTTVVFMSDKILHEVSEAFHPRQAITGWLLR